MTKNITFQIISEKLFYVGYFKMKLCKPGCVFPQITEALLPVDVITNDLDFSTNRNLSSYSSGD